MHASRYRFYPAVEGDEFPPDVVELCLLYPGARVMKDHSIEAPLNCAWLVEGALRSAGVGYKFWIPKEKIRKRPGSLNELIETRGLRRMDPKTGILMTDFLARYQREEPFRLADCALFQWPPGSGKSLGSMVWALLDEGNCVIVTGAKGRLQWRDQLLRYTTTKTHVCSGIQHMGEVEIDLYTAPKLDKRKFPADVRASFETGQLGCSCDVVHRKAIITRGKKLYARLHLPPGDHTLTFAVGNVTSMPVRYDIKDPGIPKDARFCIVSWETLPYHIDNILAWKPTTVVLDESHRGKSHKRVEMVEVQETELDANPKAKKLDDGRWVKYVDLENIVSATQKLCKQATRRACLTATPIKDRVRDVWAQLDYLVPWGFGPYWNFAKRYCNPPDAPIWMNDLTFKALGNIKVGDEVIGWARTDAGDKRRGRVAASRQATMCTSKVLAVSRRIAPLVKVKLASGKEIRCTPDHLWLTGFSPDTKCDFLPAQIGRALFRVVDPSITAPADPELAHLAGWVAGMYDGEGCRAFISQCSKANPVTYKQLDVALTKLGIPHTMTPHNGKRPGGAVITGGRDGLLKLLLMCRPHRLVKSAHEHIFNARFKTPDPVVGIWPLEGEHEVVSMTTSTGNYVVHGYASKNCAAHTNPWGGMDDRGMSNMDELIKRVDFFRSYVSAAEANANLPAMRREVIYLPADAQQREDESFAEELNKAALSKANAKSIANIRLAAACSRKRKAVVEQIVEDVNGGAKVVVFTARHHDVDVLKELIKPRLAKGALFFSGDGRDSADRRDVIRKEYMAAPTSAVLVGTGAAWGEQLDLNETDIAHIVMLPWTITELIQWEGRFLRKGSTRAVLVNYWVAEGSADEHVASILLSKLPAIEKMGTEGVEGMRVALAGNEEELIAALAKNIMAGGQGEIIHVEA